MKYIFAIVWLGSLLATPTMQYKQFTEVPRLLHTISVSGADLLEWHPERNWFAYSRYTDRQDYVSILDVTTLDTLADIPGSGGRSFSWSPDGTKLAILSIAPIDKFDLSIWSIVATQEAVVTEKIQSFEVEWKQQTLEEASIDWHPIDPVIALHDGSGLYLIDLDTGEIEPIESVGPGGSHVAWSPEGKYLAFGFVSILEYETRQIMLTRTINDLPEFEDRYVQTLPPLNQSQTFSWSPDGTNLAFIFTERSGDTQGIYALDMSSQRLRFEVTQHQGELLNAIAWSPDGSMIATVAEARFCEIDCQNLIYIRDADTLELLYRVEGHTDAITTVSWSPDSQMLATGSQDSTIRIWEIPQVTSE